MVLVLVYVSGGGKEVVEGGRRMPSSRRYERKAGVRGIIFDFRAEDRYLVSCQLDP